MRRFSKSTRVFLGSLAITIAAATAAFGQRQVPEPPCGDIDAPEGSKLAFHAYAIGVQIYNWNGSAWTLIAPAATLYADANYHGKVGTHYGGPTWESNSGSLVTGIRMAVCPPQPGTIAWLLLKRVSNDGAGLFADVNYIQRVNTVGGAAPASPGSVIGEEARIPYTAEYFFYRKK